MSTVRIQVRRGTASQWTSVNPILAAGEMGVESDSNLFKFGNGSSTWTALAYANNSDVAIGEISQDAINTALTMGAGLTKTYNDGANTITINVDSDIVALKSYVDSQITGLSNTVDTDFIPVSDRGLALGVASLNASGKVPASELDIQETVQDYTAALVQAGRGIDKVYNDASGTLTISLAEFAGDGIAFVDDQANQNRTIKLADSIHPITRVQTATVTADAVETGTLESTSNATIGGNLTVTGNLTINGTSTTVNATNYTVDDPMIYIGDNNQSNSLDLGLVAAFNDGTYQHSGLVRDASDGKWKLFSGVIPEPGSTVDFSTYTKDTLEVGPLSATSAKIGDTTNNEIQYLHGVTSAVQTQLDSKLSTSSASSTYAPKASPTFTGTVTLPDGTITSDAIADSAITSAKIANGTIVNADISAFAQIDKTKINGTAVTLADTGTVKSSMIEDGAIVNVNIAAGAQIDKTKIAGTAITAADTATVTTTMIVNETIVDGDISTLAGINKTKISGTAVTIADTGTVTSNMIANETIVNEDIATSAQIDKTKIAGTAVTLADTATITNGMLAGEIDQSKVKTLVPDLATKAPLDSPTFTGTVTLPATTAIGTVSATEIGHLDGVTSSIQTQLTALGTADTTHAGLTANVHGIADTSVLATATTVATAKSEAIAAAGTAADTKVSTAVAALTKSSVGLGNVDNTADSAKPVSTATQTALDLKAPKAAPTFTGTLTAADVTISGNLTVSGTTTTVNTTNFTTSDPVIYLGEGNNANLVDIGFVGSYNDGTYAHQGLVKDSSDGKWKLFKGVTDEPTTTINFAQGSLDALKVGAFEATTVTPSSGVVFSDGTQTKEGTPSRTAIISKTADYTLSALTERDSLIEINSASAVTVTIPANSSVAYPVGTSIDILRVGAGAVTVAAGAGVTLNYTPGNKLRAQWSGATLFKRAADTWVVYGDLSA